MATTNSRTFQASIGTGRRAFQSSITPVSTYATQVKETSGLRGLSKALGLAGDIADRQKKLQDESDKQRGLMASLVDSAGKDPAKIKAKELYPQESLAFMTAFREGQSKLWAQKKYTSWKTEYDTWEGKNSNDPQDFQNWMAGKIGEARSQVGDNQFAIAGAMPVFNEAMHNMTAAHAKYTGDRIIQEETDNILERIDQAVLNRNTTNPSHPSYDPDGTYLFGYIDNEIGMAARKGLDGGKIKEQVVKDLLATADAYDDDGLYQLIMDSSDNGLLKLKPEQRVAVETSYQNHRDERDAEDTALAKEATALRKAEEAQFLGQYLNQFAQGDFDTSSITPDLIAKYPKVFKSINAAKSQMLSLKNYVDPVQETKDLAVINARIYSDEFKRLDKASRIAELNKIIEKNKFQLSEGTVGRLYSEVAKDEKDPKVLLNNPQVKLSHTPIVSGLKRALDLKNDGTGDYTVGNNSTDFQARMAIATAGIDTTGMDATAVTKKYHEVAETVFTEMLEDRAFYETVSKKVTAPEGERISLPSPLQRAYIAKVQQDNEAKRALAEQADAERREQEEEAKAVADAKEVAKAAMLQAVAAAAGNTPAQPAATTTAPSMTSAQPPLAQPSGNTGTTKTVSPIAVPQPDGTSSSISLSDQLSAGATSALDAISSMLGGDDTAAKAFNNKK